MTVMYRPRETFRRILDGGPNRWTVQLVILAYICSAVGDADVRGLEKMLPGLSLPATLSLIALAFLLIAGIWVLLLYMFGGIATLIGRLLEGQASAADVRSALAWSMVPVIWSILYRIPLALYLYRMDITKLEESRAGLFDFIERGGLTVAILFLTLQLLMNVWFVVLASNLLGEAFRFSSWKGLATLALTFTVPVVAIAGFLFAVQ